MANYPGGQYPTGSGGTGFPQYYPEDLRYQAVSQYAFQPSAPVQMSASDRYRLVTDSRYQYGVTGGQDRRYYARQRDMNMGAGAATMASLAQSSAMMGAGWVAGALTGAAVGTLVGGPVGTVVGGTVGLLAPMVPMQFLDNGITKTLERQKFMHATANDLDQYRDRLGFKGGLSYTQSTSLGASMAGEMARGGGFFSAAQQMSINKIALSNDMISAAGPGKMSGTTQQYLKNFKELKETAELVVKTMKTTLEGGMSVIKELQGAGFNSFAQVKQQIKQASAIGAMTGIGASNAMVLGAHGAQAVQGTSWNASVGASMFQTGAMQAAAITKGSVSGAYAVQRAGGVAQAGATIATAQMNILMNSSIGTRMAAYAMNPDGTTNAARMEKLLTGKESAYGVVMGSAARGFAMGSSRVRFPFMKEDFYNSLNDEARSQMSMQAFNLWREQRGGKLEDQAVVFAGMHAQNPRDQRLLAEWLLSSNKGFGTRQRAMQADDLVQRASLNTPSGFWKLLGKTKPMRAMTAWGDSGGEWLYNLSGSMLKETSDWARSVRRSGANIIEKGLIAMGSEGFDRSVRGDAVRGAAVLHGTVNLGDETVFASASRANIDRARSYFTGPQSKADSTIAARSARSSSRMNKAADAILGKYSFDEIQNMMTDASIMLGNNTAGTMTGNPGYAKMLATGGLSKEFQGDANNVTVGLLTALRDRNQAQRAQYQKSVDEAQSEINKKGPQEKARMDAQTREARSLLVQRDNLDKNDENRFKVEQDINQKYNSLDPSVRKLVENERKLADKQLTLTGDVKSIGDYNRAVNDSKASIQKSLTSKDLAFSKEGRGVIKDTYRLGKAMGLDLTKTDGDDYLTFAKGVHDTMKKMEEDPGFKATSKLEKKTVDFITKHSKQAKFVSGEYEVASSAGVIASRMSKLGTLIDHKGATNQDVKGELSAAGQKLLTGVAMSSGPVDYDKLYKSMAPADIAIIKSKNQNAEISSGRELVKSVFGEAANTFAKTSQERKTELSKQFNALIEEQKKLSQSGWQPFKESAVKKNKEEIELVKNQLEAEKVANELNETAAGRSVGTAMAPPVLNYWNNRW